MADRARFSAPYVSDDAGALRAAVVVRPSFAIETLPPIQAEPSPIGQRALEQHDLLITRLRANGVHVTVLEEEAVSPLGFAVADSAIVLRDGAVLMRPSDLARRRDVVRAEGLLGELQIPVIGRIEAPGILDGGDVLVGRDALFVAAQVDRASATGLFRARRGNESGRTQLAAIVAAHGLRTVTVPLASEIRRLRGVAAFIDHSTLLLAQEALDVAAFAGLDRMEVPLGEEYGAGVLCLGQRRVLENIRFRTALPVLRRHGISVDAIDLWEFGKLGITPSMLVLPVKRD